MATDKKSSKRTRKVGAKSVTPPSDNLTNAISSLTQFTKNNKYSSIEEHGQAEKFCAIMRPWGDQSVAILLADGEEAISTDLLNALNSVILPERLTALFHTSRKELEIIWTAYKLADEDSDIEGRSFQFIIDSKTYDCSFSQSSKELLSIASRAMYLSVSETGFRNLQSFGSYLARRDKDPARYGNPLSFFIRGIEWNDKIYDIIRHINFYLRYYDQRCPYVIIHPAADDSKFNPKSRYPEGVFPSQISSRKLNQTLMSFWTAAFDEDVPTAFLLHCRILEFVSGYHLQNEQRQALKKILSTPHIWGNVDQTIDSLAGVVREDKGNDTVRFSRMFEELVDSDKIWNQICLNPDTFSKDMELDGGFLQAAIVSNTKSKDAFGPKGMENVARALRAIRNGLAHGGEAQAGRIILPTSRNFKKLLPWVQLIETAAGEVVLYEHLT